MPHEKFHYKSLEEVEQRAAELGVSLPFAVDTHCLAYRCRCATSPSEPAGHRPHGGADSTPEAHPLPTPCAATSTKPSAAAL